MFRKNWEKFWGWGNRRISQWLEQGHCNCAEAGLCMDCHKLNTVSKLLIQYLIWTSSWICWVLFMFVWFFFSNPGFNQGLFADCLVTKSEEKSTFTILFSLHQFITRIWAGSQQTQWSVQLDGMVSGFSLGSWADVPHKLLRWQQSQPAYGLGETVPGACRRSSWVVPTTHTSSDLPWVCSVLWVGCCWIYYIGTLELNTLVSGW